MGIDGVTFTKSVGRGPVLWPKLQILWRTLKAPASLPHRAPQDERMLAIFCNRKDSGECAGLFCVSDECLGDASPPERTTHPTPSDSKLHTI